MSGSSRHIGWTALAAALAFGGCGEDDPHGLSWQIEFVDPSHAERARVLEARILEGGCEGTVEAWSERVVLSDLDQAMRPPDLAPGTWGFAVVAVDVACIRYAEGCLNVELPQEGAAGIVVGLTPQTEQRICAESLCSEGQCEALDGGGIVCPERTGDCNGNPNDGCETAIDTPQNCGGCGVDCRLPHATAECEAATCAVAACEEGWFDCDGLAANGCETSIRTTTDCGACGAVCQLPQAAETCAAGRCEIVACHPGWEDCDGTLANGCEAALSDAATCGACDVSCADLNPLCAAPAGEAPACVAACPAGTTACGSSCVDLQSDARHCGACDMQCESPHGIARCAVGSCQLSACEPLWDDCDADDTNGCEQPLFTTSDCGGCGVGCEITDAVTSCVTGTCSIDTCWGGFEDCDGTVDTGCEADLSSALTCGTCEASCDDAEPVCGVTPSGERTCLAMCAEPAATMCGDRCLDTRFDNENCGACGVRCIAQNGVGRCFEGDCLVESCDEARGNCDGIDSNGCETDLLSNTAHCGACGNACTAVGGAEPTCVGGECQSVCPAGAGDCNDDMSDGCETTLDSTENCGGCGIQCAPAHATGSCATGSCEIVSCDTGYEDCDTSVGNGCEADLQADPDNCGSCGNECRPPRCSGGACF